MGVMADRLAVQSDLVVRVPPDFGGWMKAEQRRVFLLCHRLLRDRDEADTATQDVFLKAHRALSQPTGPPIEDPRRWLTRIAVNTCLDRLRSRRWQFWRRRSLDRSGEMILASTPAGAPSAEDRVWASQIAARLAEAIGRLSHRQQAVFILRHYEDLSLEEIAAVLRLEIGTVKAHMARAFGKLRGELRDLYEMSHTGAGAGRVS